MAALTQAYRESLVWCDWARKHALVGQLITWHREAVKHTSLAVHVVS